MIKYVKGSATSIQPNNCQNFLIHICNDSGLWGAGFVLALSQKWKLPEIKYREWFSYGTNFKLGNIQKVKVEPNLSVVNMIAQNGIRSKENPKPLNLSSLEVCLSKVLFLVNKTDKKTIIHMPKIGAGLAGGNWDNEILPLIEKIFFDVDVFVYEL